MKTEMTAAELEADRDSWRERATVMRGHLADMAERLSIIQNGDAGASLERLLALYQEHLSLTQRHARLEIAHDRLRTEAKNGQIEAADTCNELRSKNRELRKELRATASGLRALQKVPSS